MIKDNQGVACPWWYGFFPYARPGREGSVPVAIPRSGTEEVRLALSAHPAEDSLKRCSVGDILRLTHTQAGLWMAGKWSEELEPTMIKRLKWLANNNACFGLEIFRVPRNVHTPDGQVHTTWKFTGAMLVHPTKQRYPHAWVRPVQIWPELIQAGTETVSIGVTHGAQFDAPGLTDPKGM